MEGCTTLARKAVKAAKPGDTAALARAGQLLQWGGDLKAANELLNRCIENLEQSVQTAEARLQTAHLAVMLRRHASRKAAEAAMQSESERIAARCIYLGDLAFQENYSREDLQRAVAALERDIEDIPDLTERDSAMGSLILSTAILEILDPKLAPPRPKGPDPAARSAEAILALRPQPEPGKGRQSKASLILDRAERIAASGPERQVRNPAPGLPAQPPA